MIAIYWQVFKCVYADWFVSPRKDQFM